MDEESVRSMISDLRDDMVEKIEKLRTDLRDDIQALRDEIDMRISEVHQGMNSDDYYECE